MCCSGLPAGLGIKRLGVQISIWAEFFQIMLHLCSLPPLSTHCPWEDERSGYLPSYVTHLTKTRNMVLNALMQCCPAHG